MTYNDKDKIKDIEAYKKASQFSTSTLKRLLNKAKNNSYAFDRINLELLKRGIHVAV